MPPLQPVDTCILDAINACEQPAPLWACWAMARRLHGDQVPLDDYAKKRLVRGAIGRLRAARLVRLTGRRYEVTGKGWRRLRELRAGPLGAAPT